MISALAWVRKGVAAERPSRHEMTEEEYARLQTEAASEINEAKRELKQTTDTELLNDPALKDFDLEHYDSENSSDEEAQDGPHIFSNIKGLSFYAEDEHDPLINGEDDAELEAEEAEEERVFATDNLLLVAKTEDDISSIDMCVFEPESDSLFVHHDFMLPAFPLQVTWLDYRVGRKAKMEGSGNYVAVATFEPRIEIWDLDTLDAAYPDLVLGTTDKKALRKAKGKPHKEFHTDAVMDMSWNTNVRNLLASSSADTTVKLWDLSSAVCVQSYEHHKNKVQAVQWHPSDSSVLLTGGYDKRVSVFDSRAPNAISWWTVDADVESVMWDVHSPSHFYVATDSGLVRYFDVRMGENSAPVFTLVAHDEAVSAMDQHPTMPGMLVTGSSDETVKVWDVRTKPSMVMSRNPDVGSIFSAKFCPDEPMLLAMGGSNGESRIWDMATTMQIRRVFGGEAVASVVVEEKPMVGIQNDEDKEEDPENTHEAVIAEMRGTGTQPTDGDSGDSDESMDSDSD
ncbi:rRNA-processing protein [Coemansia sp. RSA 1807]|nr:rRNA-processing protein [Coemansia sp. RSA 1591]KAJ1761096.1 rRNA-processing protein [Coemansia sp. RSA 1752]KAJ1787728.1 rRNA-processing protein [Coemansia sp. RSA 1938]KAJ1792087.1 rRNA-processing protein [Coemansia sp. RSA 2167]KAJ2129013.1 rRNA-processing protein [Coemansia sp. RSA 921]KAJ2142551.1 rRNA-processing protein [Coemansia sp. RSA 564]KAJ2153972.1 rRNA-processing protein [Coemansia sp. RSA 637]KAJ2164141.1 rRNA-processing protein [Coemansia sp. RSA 562]KAJ2180533.1 rRNA-pro